MSTDGFKPNTERHLAPVLSTAIKGVLGADTAAAAAAPAGGAGDAKSEGSDAGAGAGAGAGAPGSKAAGKKKKPVGQA